jgi:hypothetical protein
MIIIFKSRGERMEGKKTKQLLGQISPWTVKMLLFV